MINMLVIYLIGIVFAWFCVAHVNDTTKETTWNFWMIFLSWLTVAVWIVSICAVTLVWMSFKIIECGMLNKFPTFTKLQNPSLKYFKKPKND